LPTKAFLSRFTQASGKDNEISPFTFKVDKTRQDKPSQGRQGRDRLKEGLFKSNACNVLLSHEMYETNETLFRSRE
jgi:hypothetical protein